MKIYDLVTRYREAGFSPFPLSPLSKVPPDGSDFTTIEVLPFTESSNIGLFPGSPNNIAVVDADDQISQTNISDRLVSMGLFDKTTRVYTPHRGGFHYWLRVPNVPLDLQSYYILNNQIGRGEIRLHKNAYVVAPGSALPEGVYVFQSGGIEEYLAQPVVEWKDVTWLLPDEMVLDKNNLIPVSLPVRLIYRPNPPALNYFKKLATAKKGEIIHKVDISTGEILDDSYPSRSEAEAAIIVNLILAGWSFDDIQRVFKQNEPGHYIEHNDPDGYLEYTYMKAIQYLVESDPRNRIADIFQHFSYTPWPGRGGEYNQKVLQAILSKAWQFQTYEPFISYREISEFTGINRLPTIGKVIKRLNENHFLRIIPTDKKEASRIDLSAYVNCNSYHINFLLNNTYMLINNIPPVTNVSVFSDSSWDTTDLWSYKNLGGSAKLVYSHLDPTEAKTVKELNDLTGKCSQTVRKALSRLEREKLAIKSGHGWIRGSASLDEIAQRFDTKSQAISRQYKHLLDRQNFQKMRENHKER